MAKVTVRQTGSPIRRTKDQRATLAGLGLNRVGRVSTLEDTPSVRGMIAKGTPLAEAALAGGFADQSHMTRTFVRAYGITPGAYALAFG